ncbi:murein biosynthesis integral membrane protein MurJ [Microvirga sp. 3-52]|uniref:murein biosynthesis integral membrane protein MurJ n=1 Tax=Microvirga sp. 3-52 TaxID=2792425 RepID=UPI001ACD89B8|nr:murein biosynthesis integral membrane protein MurJ [Microvirga sp. 3-52]MBO1906136.1 murein biosynthesis integral membrane protein MurJ [Microvirga sp. 3-52]MBS7453272.1 murein biosynthesis integral membrane protein MurJ [Microvirga sp. 3-52]
MSLIRSSLLVGLGSMASRVLGFVRDVLFAQALGAGPVADAFLAASRLPNLVRRIVGEGGLNPVLVPALSRLEPDDAAATAGDVLSVFGMALLALTGLVEIGAGLLAFILAPGLHDDGGTLALVTLYTRLSFPVVLCVTLASIGAAVLNMRGRFAATALAPLTVNGGLILALIGMDRLSLPLVQKATWLAAASSLAGLIQLALVAAALWSGKIRLVRFRKPRWSPLLKNLLLAGLPVLAASGAMQLFILAATQIASFWPSGVSWLYYGERVMQLPLGLMAALGSGLLLPELARRHRAGEIQAIVTAQNRALEVALLLALPASAALFILARPMSSMLFERGAFQSSDAEGTALVLMALSLGLPFATAAKVLSQTLFARGSLRAALLAAILGLALTVATSLPLAWPFGPTGIALGVSVGCLGHAVAVASGLRRFGLWSPDRALLARVTRIAGAVLTMSVGLVAAMSVIPQAGVLSLTSLCLGGLFLYALAAWATGAVTRDDWAALRKKS